MVGQISIALLVELLGTVALLNMVKFVLPTVMLHSAEDYTKMFCSFRTQSYHFLRATNDSHKNL